MSPGLGICPVLFRGCYTQVKNEVTRDCNQFNEGNPSATYSLHRTRRTIELPRTGSYDCREVRKDHGAEQHKVCGISASQWRCFNSSKVVLEGLPPHPLENTNRQVLALPFVHHPYLC